MSRDNASVVREVLANVTGIAPESNWEDIAQRIHAPIGGTSDIRERRASIDEWGNYHPCPIHHDSTAITFPIEDIAPPGVSRTERRETRERAAAVAETAIAASRGDMESLQDSVKDAFSKIDGDPAKFRKYAADLQKELRAEGIDVRFGNNTIAFHKKGDPLAVEFQLHSNLDYMHGQRTTSIVAQPYDWLTKFDVHGEDARRIVGGFNEDWRDIIFARQRRVVHDTCLRAE